MFGLFTFRTSVGFREQLRRIAARARRMRRRVCYWLCIGVRGDAVTRDVTVDRMKVIQLLPIYYRRCLVRG